MSKVLGIVLAALLFSVPARADEQLDKAAAESAQELAKAVPGAKPKIAQIAVLSFTEVGPGAAGWGKRAADVWAVQIAEAAKVKALGPTKLAGLLNEKQLAALSTSKPGESAKLLNAQAVLSGEVMDQTDKLAVSVRLVSVVTGSVLAASRQTFALAAAPKPVATKPVDAPLERPQEEPKGLEASRAGGVESASIEVLIRKLADKMAEALAKMPGNARYRRIAVVPFKELGEQAKKHQIGAIVTAELATNLRRDHGLLLVERAQLTQVMAELRFQEVTNEDASAATNLGQLADAQALVIGSVADVGDKYLINARVVSTATAQTLTAESVSLPAASMVAMASDSVVLRSRSGAVFRSLIVPGWGQFYNRQAWKGIALVATEVLLLGGALSFHLTGNWAVGRYEENTADTAWYWSLASQRYQWRNIMLYVAAGVWVLNLIDAYASGTNGDSALSGGAVAQKEPVFVPIVSADDKGAYAGALIRW